MFTLDPCPFCGETVDRNISHFPIPEGVSERYAGYCISCGARGPIRDTKEKAANAWNERPTIRSNPTAKESRNHYCCNCWWYHPSSNTEGVCKYENWSFTDSEAYYWCPDWQTKFP